jgi:hypothetical protein
MMLSPGARPAMADASKRNSRPCVTGSPSALAAAVTKDSAKTKETK